MQKIIILAFLAVILSSCSGKVKQADFVEQDSESQFEEIQEVQNFDIIEDESMAKEINQQTQAAIEEIEVSDRIFFDLNSSSLSADAKSILDKQSAWLKNDLNIKIIVEGHCDERGTREYNLALGEKRANAVKKYLVSNGVDSSRVKTTSFGKERPEFIGSGEEVWSKNRRSITVVKE